MLRYITHPQRQELIKIITVASTLTDENGNYLMYLAPGTYNIVAVADGFTTSSKPPVTVEYDTVYTEDFTLTSNNDGAHNCSDDPSIRIRYSHDRVPPDFAQRCNPADYSKERELCRNRILYCKPARWHI